MMELGAPGLRAHLLTALLDTGVAVNFSLAVAQSRSDNGAASTSVGKP
jgi:hypothetical protein